MCWLLLIFLVILFFSFESFIFSPLHFYLRVFVVVMMIPHCSEHRKKNADDILERPIRISFDWMHTAAKQLRNIFCVQLMGLIRRILVSKSTSVGMLRVMPKWSLRSRQSIYVLFVEKEITKKCIQLVTCLSH